eukprot:gene16052-16722_t
MTSRAKDDGRAFDAKNKGAVEKEVEATLRPPAPQGKPGEARDQRELVHNLALEKHRQNHPELLQARLDILQANIAKRKTAEKTKADGPDVPVMKVESKEQLKGLGMDKLIKMAQERGIPDDVLQSYDEKIDLVNWLLMKDPEGQ